MVALSPFVGPFQSSHSMFGESRAPWTPLELEEFLNIWINPFATDLMINVPGLRIDGRNGQFLSSAHTSDLVLTGGALTIEMWVLNLDHQADSVFAHKGTSASGWSVRGQFSAASQSNGPNHAVLVGATNGRGTYTGDKTVANIHSHSVIYGSGTTFAIQRNGVVESTSTNMNAAPVANTTPVYLARGNEYFSAYKSFNGLWYVFRFWTRDIGAEAALSLWDDSENELGIHIPLGYEELDPSLQAGCVIALDCMTGDKTAAAWKTCKATGRVFADGGTTTELRYGTTAVNTVGATSGWYIQEVGGALLYNTSGTFPYWERIMANTTCRFSCQGLTSTIEGLLDSASADHFSVFMATTMAGTESFFHSSESDTNGDANNYIYLGWTQSSSAPQGIIDIVGAAAQVPFVRKGNGGTNLKTPFAAVDIDTTSWNNQHWRYDGEWKHWRNGTQSTVVMSAAGTDDNSFGQGMTDQSRSVLGGQDTALWTEANPNVGSLTEPSRIATIVVTNTAIANHADVRRWMGLKHGLAA